MRALTISEYIYMTKTGVYVINQRRLRNLTSGKVIYPVQIDCHDLLY